MRSWAGILWVVVLAGGTGATGSGCGNVAGVQPKDAAQAVDVPVSSGGTAGTGGAVGSGGSTLIGGTTGMPVGGAGGPAGAGAGGRGGTVSGGAGGSAAGGTGGTTTRDAGATGGTGGLDAEQTSTYSGCLFIGGINRAVVAKFDPQAGICVALVLSQPGYGPDAGFGLTITQGWGVESASLWPSTKADCAQRFPPGGAASASSASGSVSISTSSTTIDVDAVLYLPANDAGPAQSVELKAPGVDINHGC